MRKAISYFGWILDLKEILSILGLSVVIGEVLGGIISFICSFPVAVWIVIGIGLALPISVAIATLWDKHQKKRIFKNPFNTDAVRVIIQNYQFHGINDLEFQLALYTFIPISVKNIALRINKEKYDAYEPIDYSHINLSTNYFLSAHFKIPDKFLQYKKLAQIEVECDLGGGYSYSFAINFGGSESYIGKIIKPI